MFEYPHEGNSSRSKIYLFSKQLKEDYARLMGIPRSEANRIIDSVGAVVHDRLLRGLPSSLPHTGIIYIKFKRARRFHVSGITGVKRNPRKKKEILYQIHGSPSLWMPKRLRVHFRDHAIYTGDLQDQFNKIVRSEKEILAIRRLKEAQKKVTVYPRTGRPRGNALWKDKAYMDEIRKKRRGLLVEDQHSVECKDGNKDTIVRTSNRAETVKSMKESKGPKPLHD